MNKTPGWYWGSMTVNEAKEKLKEAPEGTFLIRDSSHSDYLLTISVKTRAKYVILTVMLWKFTLSTRTLIIMTNHLHNNGGDWSLTRP